jgi:hypothetical protein
METMSSTLPAFHNQFVSERGGQMFAEATIKKLLTQIAPNSGWIQFSHICDRTDRGNRVAKADRHGFNSGQNIQ